MKIFDVTVKEDLILNRDLEQLKRIMKSKVCMDDMTPNYPMGAFVRWVAQEEISTAVLLVLLSTIQTELDTEEHLLRRPSNSFFDNQHQLAMNGYWRLYCSQIHAYYKALARDPLNSEKLEFLL